MGDETDHQSVRRLTEEEKITKAGDHAQVVMSQGGDGGGGSSGSSPQPAKEWVKFDEEGGTAAGTKEMGSSDKNKSSKVSRSKGTATLKFQSLLLSF